MPSTGELRRARQAMQCQPQRLPQKVLMNAGAERAGNGKLYLDVYY